MTTNSLIKHDVLLNHTNFTHISNLKSNTYIDAIVIIQHVITSLVGIVGNALVLIVYFRKLRDKQTITFFIVHLALTDLACCLFLIPLNCYHELNNPISNIRSDFICKFHTFLVIINITYSCLLMTLVAFERYFTIVWPFEKLVTKNRAKFILGILFILSLVVALLGSLSVGIHHEVLIYEGLYEGPFDSGLESLGNYSYQWRPIYNCFPNGQFIGRDKFHLIQIVQCSIIVLCFLIIFVLYAFICVFVFKRRKMKAKRANYYNEIIHRSKRNTLKSIRGDYLKDKETFDSCNNKELGDRLLLQATLSGSKKKMSIQSGISDRTNLESTKESMLNSEQVSVASDKATQTNTSSFGHHQSHIDRSRRSRRKTDYSLKRSRSGKNRDSLPTIQVCDVRPANDRLAVDNRINNNGAGVAKNSMTIPEINIDDSELCMMNLSNSQQQNYSSILMSNLKTAFMLFVVTLIMTISYTPALLVLIDWINYHPVTWNIIFLNNAANPIVYSFLNSNFRKSLRNRFTTCANRFF